MPDLKLPRCSVCHQTGCHIIMCNKCHNWVCPNCITIPNLCMNCHQIKWELVVLEYIEGDYN